MSALMTIMFLIGAAWWALCAGWVRGSTWASIAVILFYTVASLVCTMFAGFAAGVLP